MRLERLARAGLLLACMALVGWVRLLPLSLSGLEREAHDAETLRRLRAERLYTAADGRDYVYLGDLDSYLWLRHARNLLRTGTTCGTVAGRECRDTLAHAPVGRRDRYAGTLHAAAIAGVQRLITWVDPGHPLPASAYLVPVLVGMLGTLPAFFLGLRLGGLLGAGAAALLVGLDPLFLTRSAGADNDVWNVVLPLFMVWAAVAALAAANRGRRMALAVVAAGVAALHAATWSGWLFTYLVLVGGLGAAIAAQAGQVWRGLPGAPTRLASSAFVASVFVAASCAAVAVEGRGGSLWTPAVAALEAVLRAFATAPPPVDEVRWPSAFATVGELAQPNLAQVANQMGGFGVLVSAWAGTIALALRPRWRWWHVTAVATAGAIAASLIAANPRSGFLAAVAAAQMLATLLLLSARGARDDRGGPATADPASQALHLRSPADDGAALTVCLWFLAALYLSRDGARFILLLVAPAGLAAAALLGRLQLLLDSFAAAALARWPAAKLASRAAVCLVLGSSLLLPLRRGIAAARDYLPQMNDAWWQTFTDLAASAPTDAIVHTWWDRGYWAAYASERRVSVDGGSLLTHLPYWFGRALMAPDEIQSAGILRMLDCASDAVPEPEGERGAWAKLVRHGIDPLRAPQLIADLALLGRSEAEARLAARGLEAAARGDVLASTHCQPPPAYVVLSTSMLQQASWRRMGNWSFGRAFAVDAARRFPAPDAARRVGQRLGIDAQAAAALVGEASGPQSRDEIDAFVSPPSVYLLPDWFACQWGEGKRTMECPIPMNARRLALLVYDAEDPAASLVFTQLQPGYRSEETPAVVVVARAGDRSVYEVEGPSLPGIGVLFDVENGRALLASPDLVRSTFAQLAHLDGRTQREFEKVGEHDTVDGERVTTWRIRWPSDPR